ncbi:MAG: FHIPEP family type III secretion protein [Candidatus Gastranaerophilales bacterium]|nr:FHIPEP family type III secretion protein [Candidatus Gastranaerophilales bacterium]
MFDDARLEYSVKTCPANQPEDLEMLLNEMADEGWELYMLHEVDSGSKGIQYNCIFSRECEDIDIINNSEVVDVMDFKSKMEKMLLPSDEPYEECKEVQSNINQKQEEITKIKKLLDSSSGNIDYKNLNDEISTKLKELNELKGDLSDIIDPIHMYERVNQDKLTLIISDELLNLVDDEKGGDLISETVKLRQNLADKLGYIIPAIKFTNSDVLEANEYRIDVRGLKVLSGFVQPGYIRFYEGQANINRKPKSAIEDIDPVTGERVFWIEESRTKDFWENGLTPAQVIVSHFEHIVCKYVNEILDYSDINNYIGIVGSQNLYLIENLIPDALSIGDIRSIFTDLIREKVSIKDITYIFERLNDSIQETEDRLKILEKLRIYLNRQISGRIADSNNTIYGILMADNHAESLEEVLVQENGVTFFIPKDQKSKKLIKKVIDIIKTSDYDLTNIALIAPSFIRRQLFNLFEQIIPGLSVISPQEVAQGFNLEIIENIN